jgi:hypothetical protein
MKVLELHTKKVKWYKRKKKKTLIETWHRKKERRYTEDTMKKSGKN